MEFYQKCKEIFSNICQVDLADTYDHKHQNLSINNEKQGLSRMSVDIIKTFIKKLATQGHSFSKEQFRSLKATYYRAALDLMMHIEMSSNEWFKI